MKKVEVIGVGIGSRDISPSFKRIIGNGDVLVGGSRLLDLFSGHGGIKIPVRGPVADWVSGIKNAVESGKKVVVLADGDPLFFGIGRRLIDTLGREAVSIHPNVTTLQEAAARAGLSWEETRTVSLHGRRDIRPLLRALMFHDMVGVYTDTEFNPARIAEKLLEKNVDTFLMTVFENLGLKGEKVGTFPVSDAAKKAFSPLNFILLKRTKWPEIRLGLGIEDELLVHEKGLITKREVRAAGLSLLRIEPEHVVWDLGAGCGSVGIEACFLANRGMVVAVEKDENRFKMIEKNIKKTGAYALEPICGKMPGALESLPAPDRIFIGGGLGRENSVLAGAAKRLKPGGRMVIHAILMGSLNRACGFFDNAGWPWSITQVAVSRSRKLAGERRLDAENPVFIIAASKPKTRQRQNR